MFVSGFRPARRLLGGFQVTACPPACPRQTRLRRANSVAGRRRFLAEVRRGERRRGYWLLVACCWLLGFDY